MEVFYHIVHYVQMCAISILTASSSTQLTQNTILSSAVITCKMEETLHCVEFYEIALNEVIIYHITWIYEILKSNNQDDIKLVVSVE